MESMNIQRDARVLAGEEEIGRVTHVIVDPATREVTDLVVAGDGGEQTFPISEVALVDGDRVTLRAGAGGLPGTALFERDRYNAVDAERAGQESQQRAERGGAPLLDADDRSVQIGGAGQSGEPYLRRREARSQGAAIQPGGDAFQLQLREEHLRVEKREEEAGAVRVSRRVIERTESVQVPLREEHLIIERLPGSGPVTIDGRELQVGESIDVLLKAEKASIVKDTEVYEHVAIRKEVVERSEELQATLRKEELVVDDRGGLVASDEAGNVAVPRPAER